MTETHALGTFDPEDEERIPATDAEDLGGAWVADQYGQRFEVDEIIAVHPTVVQATEKPPFGEWDQVGQVEVPDEPDW